MSALDNDHFHLALVCFERAAQLETSPLVISAHGLCLAAVRNEYQKGIDMCRQALAAEPAITTHYYHLGRVLLLSGERDEAVRTFRQGLAAGRDERIIRQMEALGTRAPAVIPALPREHFLNKWLGILLGRLGFR